MDCRLKNGNMVPSVQADSSDADPAVLANPVNAEHRSLFRRLVAADERKLLTTIVIALALVGWLAVGLPFLLPQETWMYQFLFKRSFVQWVLLSAFSIGLVHLLRRIPEWLLERKALRFLRQEGAAQGACTLVERRWLQLQAARGKGGRRDIEHFAKSLADHDDAEIDAAYRLTIDIVQILPLIGFFGTVFGLSHGLYQSFLATGGATTKDFAKAIAIAFDNTLLGLGLTIILFGAQSILRKRDEAVLLELNLLAGGSDSAPYDTSACIYDLATALRSHEATLKDHQKELAEALSAIEAATENMNATLLKLSENLAARDSTLVHSLAGALDSHLSRIRDEIRRPRTIRFVESAHFDSNDGENPTG
jgi:biopolymer transport protein ExbB/TolQ